MQLLTTVGDILAVWDMAVYRTMTPAVWAEQFTCQHLKCGIWFLCNSTNRCYCNVQHILWEALHEQIPHSLIGFEYAVPVCEVCFSTMTGEDRAPLAIFYNMEQDVIYMFPEDASQQCVMVGLEKICDVSHVLH